MKLFLPHLLLFRVFAPCSLDTFIRCEKYSGELDISRSLIYIFVLNVYIFALK